MKKTDYTKAENLLNEGMLKMTVQELLDLADKVSAENKEGSTEAPPNLPSLQARSILLAFMMHDFEILSKAKGLNVYSLGTTLSELEGYQAKISELTQENWEEIKKVRTRLINYKKEMWDRIPHLTNEQIIAKERKKHINKRFNTRDKWLPLH